MKLPDVTVQLSHACQTPCPKGVTHRKSPMVPQRQEVLWTQTHSHKAHHFLPIPGISNREIATVLTGIIAKSQRSPARFQLGHDGTHSKRCRPCQHLDLGDW